MSQFLVNLRAFLCGHGFHHRHWDPDSQRFIRNSIATTWFCRDRKYSGYVHNWKCCACEAFGVGEWMHD